MLPCRLRPHNLNGNQFACVAYPYSVQLYTLLGRVHINTFTEACSHRICPVHSATSPLIPAVLSPSACAASHSARPTMVFCEWVCMCCEACWLPMIMIAVTINEMNEDKNVVRFIASWMYDIVRFDHLRDGQHAAHESVRTLHTMRVCVWFCAHLISYGRLKSKHF